MTARSPLPLLLLVAACALRAAAAPGPARWVEAGRVDTNAVALAGPWSTGNSMLTGTAGATASFRVEPTRRFYLKLRMELDGEATFQLNQEVIRLGPGLRIEPGGGLSWAALPDRDAAPGGHDRRHTLELICQDGCLDVLWDNASAGFGTWSPDQALTNGTFRVEKGAASWSAMEWRGPQGFATPAAPGAVATPGPPPVADAPSPMPEPAVAGSPTAPQPAPPTAPPPPSEPMPAPVPPTVPPPPAEPGDISVIAEAPPPVPLPRPGASPIVARTDTPVLARVRDNPDATLNALRSRMRKKAGITWVFAGDSITLGGHFTQGGRSYPEHFQERIRWEMKRFDDAVINTAFNGATTDQLAAVLEERVLRHHPDVVFLMVGSNDSRRGEAWLARYREWMEILVTRLRNAGALVILQTANHPVSNRDPTLLRNDTLYMQAVRETAQRMGVPLIDHWNLWLAFHSDHEGRYDWMGDQIHPNARGHLRMAMDIFRILGLYDPGSKIVQLEDGEARKP